MRYHLKNKATHWTGGGDLHFVWCVTDNNGKHLTPWMSKYSALVEIGKLLAAQRRDECMKLLKEPSCAA